MFGMLPKELVIEDICLPVVLQRTKRKTMTIQVTKELELWIKAPVRTPERDISHFVMQKQFWIYKQAKRIMEGNVNRIQWNEEEMAVWREKARKTLTDKSYAYADQLGVTFNRIRIGNQATRWGSCSSKGTISYNWRLILMPESIMDYVVVHELCHLLEMNHSKQFWHLVASILPDYEGRRAWLKQHGNEY